MLESLFNKVIGHQSCNLIERRLQHSYFPVNIATGGCFGKDKVKSQSENNYKRQCGF